MGYIKVDPNQIYFSQDSISNTFSTALGKKLLGVVLDEIVDGSKDIKVLTAKMKLSYYPGYGDKLFTVNNRSLWVLRQLRLSNQAKEIQVQLIPNYIKNEEDKTGFKRFTTKNGGTKVIVRADPKGKNTKKAGFWEIRQHAVPMAYGGLFLAGGAEEYDSDEEYE